MWKIHDDGTHPCYNMKNVKSNYEMLLLLRDMWKRFPTKGKYNDYEDVKDLKQGIRIYFKNQSQELERRVFDADYDGATFLIELPEEIKTEEIAEAWFEANEHRECVPSQYDCTGQEFTAWHKLVKRRGRWRCYHRICFDV